MSDLPPYVPRALVRERLPLVFPEGTPDRAVCIRDLAAATVFTMLYIGALDGTGRYLAPKHVYRMTAEQSGKASDAARHGYRIDVMKPGFMPEGERWYADNTREPIRDETLREGLVEIGAVTARDDLPTTSSKPRYALDPDFAALFDPALQGQALEEALAGYRATHLSKSALTRISIMRAGATAVESGVLVTFPNQETRQLAPGPSSIISRAVIEIFAPRFLEHPAILWLSESGNKVVAKDDKLASSIGLHIETDRNLPDLILVDLGPADPLLVFVEAVATDGAITPRRQKAIFALTDAAGFARSQVAFLTAYEDRASSAFKKTVSGLAWGSFAWFASEPGRIVALRDENNSPLRLSDLTGNFANKE